MFTVKKTQDPLISFVGVSSVPLHMIQDHSELGSEQVRWYKQWESNSLNVMTTEEKCRDTPPLVVKEEVHLEQLMDVTSLIVLPPTEISESPFYSPSALTVSPLKEVSFSRSLEFIDTGEARSEGFDGIHSQDNGIGECSIPLRRAQHNQEELTFEHSSDQEKKDYMMLLQSWRLHVKGVETGIVAASVTGLALMGLGCFSASDLYAALGVGVISLAATACYFLRILLGAEQECKSAGCAFNSEE